MLDHAPLYRETMQTLPFDLREYAARETGPESWSAAPESDALFAGACDAVVCDSFIRTTEALVSISPSDVPRVSADADDFFEHVTLREAFVIVSIDGQSTLEEILETLDMPTGEVLSIICELCASGIIALERSRRDPRRSCEARHA